MTCDIRYDSPMMTELATFPPLLAVSGIAVLVTGVALLARNHHTRIKEKS